MLSTAHGEAVMATYDRAGRRISKGEWLDLNTEEYKRVGLARYEGGVSVSTVWLGLDHGLSRRPQIFETMIFGPPGYPYNEGCMRYASEAAAILGHRRTCHDIEHGNRPWFLPPQKGK
jgi:hypothetical protein